MATLQQVKNAQPGWFSRSNRRFFNDISYKVLHGKISKRPYLIRSTYAWTDMFGGPQRLHYRINALNEDLTVGKLVNDTQYQGMDEVKDWLAEN